MGPVKFLCFCWSEPLPVPTELGLHRVICSPQQIISCHCSGKVHRIADSHHEGTSHSIMLHACCYRVATSCTMHITCLMHYAYIYMKEGKLRTIASLGERGGMEPPFIVRSSASFPPGFISLVFLPRDNKLKLLNHGRKKAKGTTICGGPQKLHSQFPLPSAIVGLQQIPFFHAFSEQGNIP